MRLYRQIHVTSAEQLDALPLRTPVMIGPFLAWRDSEGSGWSMTLQDVDVTAEDLFAAHSDDWDYVALVPIETEEPSGAEVDAALDALLPGPWRGEGAEDWWRGQMCAALNAAREARS